MKIVKINTNNGTKNYTVSDDTTLKEFFRENEISIEGAALALDGWMLQRGDLDKTMGELSNSERVTIGVTRKTQNACSVTVLGHNAVLKSTLTREELKNALQYAPETTVVTKNEEPVFAVSMCGCAYGSVNSVGVEFGTTDSPDGKLTAQIEIPCEVEGNEIKDFLTEWYAKILLNVDVIEKQIHDEMENIGDIKAVINDHIVIM